jgi:hypothetical protein
MSSGYEAQTLVGCGCETLAAITFDAAVNEDSLDGISGGK